MSKGRHNDLLAAIQRKVPSSPESTTEVVPPAGARHEASVSGPSGYKAHRVQFYMHDDDRKIVRELSAWLAGQGIRASDSLVIRTALRLANTGQSLLNTYRDLEKQDRRYKENKAS
jgi:hypothetical protein